MHPKGRRRACGEGASKPKNVTATQQVKGFLQGSLEVTGVDKSQLFCKACQEKLSLKKNVIVSHVSSTKHKTGKGRLALKEAKERDLVKLLRETNTTHPLFHGTKGV